MTINSGKSSNTVFTNAGKRKNYEKTYALNMAYGKNKIKMEAFPKFLGIVFDPKLSFNEHVYSITPKIYKRINILRILKGKLWRSPSNFLINLYKSIIRPIFEYANFPFISMSDSNFSKMQKIENKIVRLYLSSSIYDSTVEIHETSQLDLLKPRLLQTFTKYILNSCTKKQTYLTYNKSRKSSK